MSDSLSETLQQLKDKTKLYLQQNRWIDAKYMLMQILKIKPSNDVILTKIGEVNEKLNQFDDALCYYLQAIKINPQNVRALKQLGLLYQYEFDDASKAEQYYAQYININAADDFIYFNLAKLCTKQQKYSHALEMFKKCDFTKAAVNYHFGVYKLAVGDLQLALQHFQNATNIKPKVVKYHFEYGKLCVKLNHYDDAMTSFRKASKLSECKDAEVLFANALCFKYYANDYDIALVYITLALQLKPNHIPYKYFHLKCLQNTYLTTGDIAIRVIQCSNIDDEYINNALNDTINKKLDLLVCGYVRKLLSINVYIPCDVLLMLKYFFHGDKQQIPYPKMYIEQEISQELQDEQIYMLTEFGKQEMTSMFFDALCPGKDEAKLIFTITKLHDYAMLYDESRSECGIYEPYYIYSFMLLQSICKFSNINNSLSIIEQTEDYFNYKKALTKLCVAIGSCNPYNRYESVSLLFQLFRDNGTFYTMYKSFEKNQFDIVPALTKEYFTVSNLKYIRLIIMKHIFGIDDENNEIKNSVTTLKTLSNCIDSQITWNTHQSTIEENMKVACMLRLIGLEIQCLNTDDLNYDLTIAMDNITNFIWDNMHVFAGNMRTCWHMCMEPVESLCLIFQSFKKMNLNLKPYEMEWNDFFGKISLVACLPSYYNGKYLQNDVKKLCETIWNYCKEIDVNNKCYENWMHCIDLLSVLK